MTNRHSNMTAVVFALSFVTAVALRISDEEPHCSKFDYEYKMLERLVELEHTTKVLVETVGEQRQEINKLKQIVQPHTVLAEVQIPSRLTVAVGDAIIFTQPVTNIGNAYNTDFGFFEPPLNGTYIFSVSLCTAPNTWIVLGIMKDKDILDEYIVGDEKWHTCGTATTVSYASTKNKIWVKVLRTRTGIIDKGYGLSSFSGALLNTSPAP